ncbi:MAG: zinc-dependent metalloprotease [Candidatus Dadabacteria bacterium]
MKSIFQTLCGLALMCASQQTFAQVPIYNSYPAATATIFLDFDGQTVNGTSWNSDGPIVCNSSNLSATQVSEIYNRIAEDYRPFNLNITTDSAKYLSAPVTQRMRVVFTTSSDWYGSAGGVSFVNSFTWGDNTPAFVFTALLNYNTKNISEAGSHEVGHTLGLRHQAAYDANCVKTSEYNAGTGTGEIGWAPIMGVGYSKNFTLWNNGANPLGCTSIQDDLGIITSDVNGFGYRPDDFSNSIDGAAVINFAGNAFKVNGIIESDHDVDVIQFNVATKGTFHLDAIPFNVGAGNAGSDIDLELQLLDNSGVVLRTYNPGNTLSATIDTTLNSGSYYLKVNGSGNAYVSNYASLGSYTLNATFSSLGILPLHRLQLNGVVKDNQHSLNWDIVADENITNQSLEVSTDGANFHNLANLSSMQRSFNNNVQNSSSLFYRIKLTLDNNSTFYSNIIELHSKAVVDRPHLVSNVITGVINVSSPSEYKYFISDLNGRILQKGVLREGNNPVSTYISSAGMYLISYSNGKEYFTDKFMKK